MVVIYLVKTAERGWEWLFWQQVVFVVAANAAQSPQSGNLSRVVRFVGGGEGTTGGNRALASNPTSGVDVGTTGYLPAPKDYRTFVEASSWHVVGRS